MDHEKGLERYCQGMVAAGATHALVTEPKLIVTAPWVRWKCQYGCPFHGKSYCCPPHSPPPEETRRTLDGYHRVLLFHLQWTKGVQRGQEIKDFMNRVPALEKELFFAGFYKALALLCGPCVLCKECAMLQKGPCNFPDRARPSMEACGIDVYQTARNHGLPIQTLTNQEETRNLYALILVD